MERSEAIQRGRRTECCDCSLRNCISSVKAKFGPFPFQFLWCGCWMGSWKSRKTLVGHHFVETTFDGFVEPTCQYSASWTPCWAVLMARTSTDACWTSKTAGRGAWIGRWDLFCFKGFLRLLQSASEFYGETGDSLRLQQLDTWGIILPKLVLMRSASDTSNISPATVALVGFQKYQFLLYYFWHHLSVTKKQHNSETIQWFRDSRQRFDGRIPHSALKSQGGARISLVFFTRTLAWCGAISVDDSWPKTAFRMVFHSATTKKSFQNVPGVSDMGWFTLEAWKQPVNGPARRNWLNDLYV